MQNNLQLINYNSQLIYSTCSKCLPSVTPHACVLWDMHTGGCISDMIQCCAKRLTRAAVT